ncbi:porin [Photobacterium damselae]|uniref:porin n=1 Tax=Photobacterium damselae TaxID=38293 RepID=UPI001EEE49A0|nr:porin [Photobacterium damselae]UKA04514.1 porin [Photobacterium damselae subsp. damselae]
MKKMILSAVTVALSSVAAHAATNTTVSNPEIYGNLGVSIDHFHQSGVEDQKDALNYTRNTKLGVRGDANVNGIHTNYAIEGDFKNPNETFGLSKAEVNLGLGMANVTVGKFDNRFEQVAGDMDAFSDTFSGLDSRFDHGAGSATGVAVSVSPIQDLNVGVQVSGQEDSAKEFGKDVAVFSHYSLDNLDLSAGYQVKAKSDSRPVKSQAFSLAAGYTIDNVYVDGYFTQDKAKGDKALNRTGLAAAYNIDENLVVKGGYDFQKQDEMKMNTFRVAAQYNINDVELNLGYANSKVKGEKSDNLMTAGVVYKF